MSDLRTAAQQALEALQWHYRQGHSNTLGGFRLKIDEKALRELRAALAQQDELQPMSPEQRQRWEELAAMPQQAEPLNLSDPAVQKRLAAQWGYVPQRKPLTEEKKRALADKFLSCQPESYEVSGVFDLISAVERAHGIKE